MPVYKMLDEMPYTELRKWVSFFDQRPIGWREDFRSYMIMKSFGFKGKPEDAFVSIQHLKKVEKDKQINDRAIPKGPFLAQMLKAKDGDGFNLDLGGKNGSKKTPSKS